MLKKLYFIFLLFLIANSKKLRQQQHEIMFCIFTSCPVEYSLCIINPACLGVQLECIQLGGDFGKSLQSTKDYIECLQNNSEAFALLSCVFSECTVKPTHLSLLAKNPRKSLQKVMKIMHQLEK